MSSGYLDCDINHSDKGNYYEMKVGGKFYGNYDSVVEAAEDYEKLFAPDEEEEAI